MNKELCKVLKEKVKNLPYADIVGGMVQTVVTRKSTGEADKDYITQRFPVTYDVIVEGRQCTGMEYAMIPNSSRKSLIYFEDFGITSTGKIHGATAFTSQIRMVCWINRANVTSGIYTEISGNAIALAMDAVRTKRQQENVGIFSRLVISMAKLPIQDAAIFNRYSYEEETRQYLRPPMEFFALDLTCKYAVVNSCLPDISYGSSTCY